MFFFLRHSKVKGGESLPRRSFSLLFLLVLMIICHPVSAEKLIPMGHTIEVELQLKHYFVTENKRLESGEKLLVYDQIKAINGQKITQQILAEAQKNENTLTIQRGNEEIQLSCTKDEWQQLKHTFSNATEGIGTLTYITEDERMFGAVGHEISLKNGTEISGGFIHLSKVQSVVKSEKNAPGYKKIHPIALQENIGEVKQNTVVGVFGKWDKDAPISGDALPLKATEDINVGEASMYTQVKDGNVEIFSINITQVADGQLEFEITDKELLAITGGVIQGMSGSPIIQDNYFVGAVTHMFVENPKKGAAIPIVDMYERLNK